MNYDPKGERFLIASRFPTPPPACAFFIPGATVKQVIIGLNSLILFKIKDALGNKQYKPEDTQELFCELFNDVQYIHEELAEYINTLSWNRPAFCNNGDDDDEDCTIAVTPDFLISDSPSMGDEHLNTIPAMKSDKLIKSCVENLVPNPSESQGENGYDLPACFTTFSNVLFDADYEFDSVGHQSLHNEDVLEKIFSNPLFEEIISRKIDPHHFDAESNLIESMLNHDSSIISSSLKINSLLDEFAGELTLLKSISPGIDDTDCHPENKICLTKRLLYDNSYPRPPEEFVSENSNADIESFSPSPIPIKDSDSYMEEIDLSFNPDDPMPPGIEDDDDDSERDILSLERLLHDDPIPLLDTLDFSYEVRVFLPFFTYLVTSSILHSFGNEDTIFDPGIAINHFLFI
nr:hypothetical protein [Tanacetum cinerariifolium]